MLYSEDFKRQVVKKALSPGVIQTEICRKLNISGSSLQEWKKKYAAEVSREIPLVDLGPLLEEKPVDLEELLRQADAKFEADKPEEARVLERLEELKRQAKEPSKYGLEDRYAVVRWFRETEGPQVGVSLRQLGLSSRTVIVWEQELIGMAAKKVQDHTYTEQLETENKLLRKQLANAERDNKELRILIQLKKKYPTLFVQDEEAN